MAARSRSIRLKIFALLLVPLVSMIGLWSFATSVTYGDAVALRDFETLSKRFGEPAQALGGALAQERMRSVVWLSGTAAAGRGQLDSQRSSSDAAAGQLRDALTGEAAGSLTPVMRLRLTELFGQVDRLTTIRRRVDDRSENRLATLRAYSAVIDAQFRFVDSLSITGQGEVSRQAQAINTGGHVRELIEREIALIAGAAITSRRLSKDEHEVFAGLVANQRFLGRETTTHLSAESAAPYEELFGSPTYDSFRALEDQIIAGGGTAPVAVNLDVWKSGVQAFVGGLERATARSRAALADQSRRLGTELLIRLGLAGGVGLLTIAASVLLVVRVGRRITFELIDLEEAAHELAGERLPRVVERLREGVPVDVPEETPELQSGSTTEISNIAQAFSMVQRTAVEAAVGQADLRKSISQVFLNLARRNQLLLHRQLALLDSMERKATDPDDLAELFQLDHLTTRMRRHAEGLIILSGAAPGRGWRKPVRIIDVMRGAVAEIEDYTRVNVQTRSPDALVGTVVADVIHLLAELVENATAFSPPDTQVQMRGEPVGKGFVIEIEDRGLGLGSEDREEINRKLATPPEFELSGSDQLGLFVVGRLAVRHGIQVSVRPSPYGGTTAIVLLPHGIVVSGEDLDRGEPDAGAGPSRPADVRDPASSTGSAYASNRSNSGNSGNSANSVNSTYAADADAASPRDATGPAADAATRRAPRTPHGSRGPSDTADDHDRPQEVPPDPSPIGPTGRHRTRSAPPGTGSPGFPPARPASFGAAKHAKPGAEPEPEPAGAGEADATRTDADTYMGLPRRRRQTSLAPQLRMDAQSVAGAAEWSEDATRSPDEVRDLLSSMQQGWVRGREADPGGASGTGDTGDTGETGGPGEPGGTGPGGADPSPENGTAETDNGKG